MQTIDAKFPWALFAPLATLTAGIGVLLVVAGRSVGWAAIAAPLVGLLAMRGPIRPRFELTEDGVVFRRGARSPLLPWDEVAEFGLVKAGGRAVLAYRLRPGVTVLKRHPGAGFLRAKGLDYDGGYFVDQMTLAPERILQLFQTRLPPCAP
ncbi:MAG TPA: hypothetical protein VJO72_02280 [Candidatus Dormibacteraeota bacterium]|nr:hypothetical protein [Candidatus Dormibacteraeota bacterium]